MSDRAWGDGPIFRDNTAALAAECRRLGRMVDLFAADMKVKLRKKAREGYGGWDEPAKFSDTGLYHALLEHFQKNDMVDVANFAAILWYRQKKRTTI